MDILAEICKAAKEAGEIILNASNIMAATKQKGSNSNLVTKYDQEVQIFLEKRLHEVLPEAAFMGEENHEDRFREEYGKGFLFVIDPTFYLFVCATFEPSSSKSAVLPVIC